MVGGKLVYNGYILAAKSWAAEVNRMAMIL